MNNLVILSGSNGRVGSYLKKGFLEYDFNVAALKHDGTYAKYSLPSKMEVNAYKRILVIHSGQPSAPRSILERKRYMRSTYELIRDSIDHGYEFIFLSSLSAHDSNRSNYSREKIRLEKEVLNFGGAVVKLGLVTGIENSFSEKIKIIEKCLSMLGLKFLLTNANVIQTGPEELDVLIGRLAKESLSSRHAIYCEHSILVNKNLGVIRGSIRKVILDFLWVLSSLGSRRSDALLNFFEGMKVSKS